MDAVETKKLRKRLGLTQKELAEELGVPTNTLARWEQGERVPSRSSATLLMELENRYLRISRNDSEGLGWAKIDNDKTFQRLVNQLIALELDSPGYIPSSPYIGADEGWDGLYKGKYLGLSGLWCIQTKHKKTNLRAAYQALRIDLLGKGKTKGEIAKAQKNKVDYLLIATNTELSPAYRKRLEELPKGKIRRLIVWDREALSLRIQTQPWLRQCFFDTPQYPMFVPISEYFPQEEPELLSGNVGRSTEIEDTLTQILDGQSSISIVHGPGGFGKSHFLRELGKKLSCEVPEWQPWFVRPGIRDCGEAIKDEIIASRKYIIFLDNAERYSDVLDHLIAHVKSYSEDRRLVIGTRSAGLHVVNEVLKRYRIFSNPPIALKELSQEQQTELLLQSANGKKIQNPDRIVKALAGVPFLIVNVARQIATKNSNVGSLGELRKRIAEDFVDECKLATSDLIDPQQTVELVVELSVIIPFDKSDHKAKSILASTLKLDEQVITNCLDRLEERKLLKLVGNSFRFRSDMLGDLCLYNRTMKTDGEEYIRKCLERWLETKAQNVITNIAAAAPGEQEGAPHRVIQRLVRQWIKESDEIPLYEQRSRLELLRSAIQLAPDNTLDLMNAYANSEPATTDEISKLIGPFPPLNMDDYGPLITSIGDLRGYAVRTLPILMNLARRNLGGIYGDFTAAGLVKSLVNPFSHSVEDIKNVVDYLYNSVLDENADCYVNEIFLAASTALLAGSHDYSDSYEDQVTFGWRVLPPVEPVLEFRKFTLDRLIELLKHPQAETRALVVKAIQDHGETHPSVSVLPLEREIEKERKYILGAIKDLLITETDIRVLSSLETLLLRWWALEREDSLVLQLLEDFDNKRTALYTAYRYYIAPDEVIEDFKKLWSKAPKSRRWSWWVSDKTNRRKAELIPLARRICFENRTVENIVDFLELLESQIAPLQPWVNHPLIEAIHSIRGDFCSSVRTSRKLWERVPERFKLATDRILSAIDSRHVDTVVSEILRKGSLITAHDVSVLFSTMGVANIDSDKKVGWINTVIEVANAETLTHVAFEIAWARENGPESIVPFLVQLFTKADYKAFRHLVYALKRLIEKGTPKSSFFDNLKKVIIQRLAEKPRLDEYDDDLMEILFENDFGGFFDLIVTRLQQERDVGKRGDFEAIPFGGLEIVEKLVLVEAQLERLFDLAYQLERESARSRFSVESLLKRVLYKSFDGKAPYIVASCERQLNRLPYKEIHSGLWWRLSKLRINENTMPLFANAIRFAEENGLLTDIRGIVWQAVTPRSWSGSLREIPPEFVNALEVSRKLKFALTQSKARILAEEIEEDILKNIERTRQEHEEFLNAR